MKNMVGRVGPVTPTTAASESIKHAYTEAEQKATAAKSANPEAFHVKDETTFLTKEAEQASTLVWKKQLQAAAELQQQQQQHNHAVAASHAHTSAAQGAGAMPDHAMALRTESGHSANVSDRSLHPADASDRLPKLQRPATTEADPRTAKPTLRSDSDPKGDNKPVTVPAPHHADNASIALTKSTALAQPSMDAHAPFDAPHDRADKVGLSMLEASVVGMDTEAQRKAVQREREMQARTKLKEYVATADFDGHATVDFYGFGKVLGVGSFGEVRLAWHRLAGVKVAVKSYEKSRITDPSQWKRVQQEIEVLQKLNHPHVLRMFESIDTPKRIHIVTDFCSGGNLCSYVKGKGRLHEVEARKVFVQLVAAIDYLHQQGIIHRDIKLENVLFADERHAEVKLVDFGFAVVVTDQWRRLKIFCGTPSYMAPEICQRREYHGRPVDVWSLGVLLYATLVGRFPFSGKTYPDLYKKIVAGQINYPEHLSSASKDLLRRMLTVDHTRRITLQNVITHPWVVSALPAAQGSGFVSPPVVSSSPPIMAANTSILVSSDPANDVNEAVLQRCEQLGFHRSLVIAAVLGRARDACATTYYLLIARMGRNAKTVPGTSSGKISALPSEAKVMASPLITPSSELPASTNSSITRRAQSATPGHRRGGSAAYGQADPRGEAIDWSRLNSSEFGTRFVGEDETIGDDTRSPSRAAPRAHAELSGYLARSLVGLGETLHSQAAVDTLMSKDAVKFAKLTHSDGSDAESGHEMSLTMTKTEGTKVNPRRAMSAVPARRSAAAY
jgi:5'-AMP-activated protein kinase catalytic alpha subunit